MATFVYWHDACLDHDTGLMHPENAHRLRAIRAALEAPTFESLVWREPPQAEREQISRVHPRLYVDRALDSVPDTGHAMIDADTVLSPGTGEASLRAAGALCAAVDAVMAGEAKNAFCAVRPPGHHAEPEAAMGFCLFNNVAVGAEQARKAHGLKRAAVIDFDVHHGNGTQAAFWRDSDLFFASTHQMPLYPGTGAAHERGISRNILNCPLAPFDGSEEFRQALGEVILPALDKFRPDFIFISAGFDAHRDDPLANLQFETEDYRWATAEIAKRAESLCAGRLVSTLEGGYDLEALAASAAVHVEALMAA